MTEEKEDKRDYWTQRYQVFYDAEFGIIPDRPKNKGSLYVRVYEDECNSGLVFAGEEE